MLSTGSLTIMRLQVSGSLANGSQALINERWRCNLQVYALQALPHSERRTDGGSKKQTRTLKGIFQGIQAGSDWLFLPSAPFDLLGF